MTMTSPTHPAASGVDPMCVLWESMGRPNPERGPGTTPGICARCHARTDDGTRIKVVVSDKFTGWDDYTDHPDPLWCTACVWGHTHTPLRTQPWLIGGPTPGPTTTSAVGDLLAAPLNPYCAVSVPLSRQKHIVPFARWGMVATDDRALPWGAAEQARFLHVRALRTLGFSETALMEPAPRFEQLATLPPARMAQVLAQWKTLDTWRRDPIYLRVASLVTRPAKTQHRGDAAQGDEDHASDTTTAGAA